MPPIDVHAERLLPLRELPEYLLGRGLGTRVTMRAVNRWVRTGCRGVQLETIVVDRLTLTSLEAVQRWIDGQSAPQQRLAKLPPQSPTAPAPAQSQVGEHATSVHLLTEHRALPTELDRLIEALDHPRTTRAFAAGVLFRAGLRRPAEARALGLDGLLAIRGLGAKSKSVVRSLWRELQAPFGRPRRPGERSDSAGSTPTPSRETPD